MPATNAQRLVQALEESGIRFVYAVPGESQLPTLDALHESSIQVVTARHEGGAGYMALANGIVDDNVGTFIVSRAPGALHAALPIQVAAEDERPLLAIIGDVKSTSRGHYALQEMDYGKVFGPFAKKLIYGTDEDLYMQVRQACVLARTGTPGPVVLILPEDLQKIDPSERTYLFKRPAAEIVETAATDSAAVVAEALRNSKRPVILMGRGLDSRRPKAVEELAERAGIPVCTEGKAQDRFPNVHPYYVGGLGFSRPVQLPELIADADLLLSLGAGLDATTIGDWNGKPLSAPNLVAVTADAEKALKRGIASRIVAARPTALTEELNRQVEDYRADAEWSKRARELATRLRELAHGETGDAALPSVVRAASKALANKEACIAADAGLAAGWLQRCFEFTGEQISIETRGGAMGLGVPGAVAGKIARPDAPSVAFVGDGALLMTGFELATALAQKAPVVVVVFNNGCYGTIVRVGGGEACQFTNPDLSSFAASFGMTYLFAEPGADHDALFAEALSAPGGALIEVPRNGPLPRTF